MSGMGEERNGGKSINESCLRAAYCALKLRKICSDIFSVHIAIGCGKLCFGILGGVNDCWECLVSGPIMSKLSECLLDAKSKEIVVTPSFREGLATVTSLEFEQLLSGNSLLTRENFDEEVYIHHGTFLRSFESLSPVITEMLSKFVPQSVSEMISSSTISLLSELREEVSILFVGFDGYSATDHEDLKTLQPFFYAAQDTLHRSGAFVRQFLVDEKGCTLIATWGLPGRSYLDNASRAAKAAVVINHRLRELGMETSCAVTTGTVFCGAVGSTARREYCAVGDVVNLCARLMSKAAGSVLIDSATMSRLSDDLKERFTSGDELLLKGKPVPVIPFVYNSSSLLAIDELGLGFGLRNGATPKGISKFSRKAVRDNFISFFDSHHSDNSPKLMIISGSMGTGKSDSIMWVEEQCVSEGACFVHMVLTNIDINSPYRVVHGFVSKFFKSTSGNISSELAENVLEQMYPNNYEKQKMIGLPVVKFFMENANSVAGDLSSLHLPTEVIEQTIEDFISAVIHTLRSVVAVVAIENVEFIHTNSMRIIARLLQAKLNCIFIATERTDITLSNSSSRFLSYSTTGHFKSQLENLICMEDKSFVHVELPNFSLAEVESLMIADVNEKVTKRIVSSVFTMSGGNPFWVRQMIAFVNSTSILSFEELVGSLSHQESPMVKRKRFGAHSATAERDEQKLEFLVVSRLELLDMLHRSIVRCASVIGKNFSAALLVAALPVRARRYTKAALMALIAQNWITLTSGDKDCISDGDFNLFYDVLFDDTDNALCTSSFYERKMMKINKFLQCEFSFPLKMVQNVIYELMPLEDRKKLHLKIANIVELRTAPILQQEEDMPVEFLPSSCNNSASHEEGDTGTATANAFEYLQWSLSKQFSLASTHYGKAGNDYLPKSFEFSMKAASASLSIKPATKEVFESVMRNCSAALKASLSLSDLETVEILLHLTMQILKQVIMIFHLFPI